VLCSRVAAGLAAGRRRTAPTVAALNNGVSNVMMQNTLKYVAVIGCVVLVAGASASADDKDKGTLSGTWVLKGGEAKMAFSDKGVMKIFPHGESDVIVVVCNYTTEKDGVVRAKLTEFEGKDEVKEKIKEKLPLGSTFSFHWKVKGDTATLGDVKGDNVELLKSHLEGEYSLKK
jgi:hypothetical protein